MTLHSTPTNETAWTSDDLAANPHGVSDKARRVRSMFASIAGAYDLNNRVHSFGRDQAWRRATVRLAEVKPTDDVLDVACGTGDLTEAFRRAKPASVTGLDFTAEMLDIARVKSTNVGTAPPVPTYIEGDAMALPFDDDSFNIVSIAFGIRNVADPMTALREFRRVLRPGGRLLVLEFDEPKFALARWGHHLYTHRIMPWTATLIARDRSGAYRYLPRSVDTFMTRAAMRAALTESGFEVTRQKSMTMGTVTISIGDVPAP
ncbi:MAG: bifunctional demethylmenaquinone methyltransferase/2-methoxy-6-polyprenyl-1,4-benzoquinol methylase UbiE [Phycisphaerales bacterium]|nr:bifunctional demethylmenaquinone methyltransferase/2-methoxy-6-polyprenyl-1,4-benzoquinol methylase UbiE [Phycisphaerales bacterium]